MATNYVETPHNFEEIASYVTIEKKMILEKFYQSDKCFFYETCSFRKHAQLSRPDYLFEYVKKHHGIFIITRSVLMELASSSGVLNPEYVDYFRKISSAGIDILVIFEEDIYHIMDACFSANEVINRYLTWAVRMVKHPTSTITETLKIHPVLYNEIMKSETISDGSLYQRFFSAVRENKQSKDNLGEEMIALCLHILSNIISEDDGKFCVITEDKGAIGMIDSVFRKTHEQFRGKKIIIYSTPKLVQHMYAEELISSLYDIEVMLQEGNGSSRLVILGTDVYDIKNREISIECSELAQKMTIPNCIHIVY